jgi:hypothetical protein
MSERPAHAESYRVRQLPSDPSLEHLKAEAKTLRRRVRAGDPDAIALARALHPRPPEPGAFALAHAQLVVARSYGFPSWPRLRRHLEVVARYARSPHRAEPATPADALVALGTLTYGGDDRRRQAEARARLAADPALGRASIWAMAWAGDAAGVREQLARDRSLAARDGGPYRWEPLLYVAYGRASAGEPLEVARLLLAAGADPDAGFLWEGLLPFTALTGAFGGGEDAVNQPPHPDARALAELLLAAGADPNDGQVLYNCHFGAEDDYLELLFAHGLGTGDGGPWHARLAPHCSTPAQMLEDQLLFAAAAGRVERVALLLAHGVRPDGTGTAHPVHHGLNALELARARGDRELEALLSAAGATARPQDPVEALLAACMAGDEARVRALVAADPGLPAAAQARHPGRLVAAAATGRLEAVRLLAGLGFDPGRCWRESALHQAAYAGDRAMIELLLALGADPTVRDARFDATPAGWAEHQGHAELAAWLRLLEMTPRQRS